MSIKNILAVCVSVYRPNSSISFKEDIMPIHLFYLIKPLEKIRGVFSSVEISLTGNDLRTSGQHPKHLSVPLSLNAAVCIFFYN